MAVSATAATTFFVLALSLAASLQFSASAWMGGRCEPAGNRSACPGELYCCKHHCRDVLSDRQNCGWCGNRCSFGQLCCAGGCAAVAYDVNNCGGCGRICPPGQRCEYGICGYA